MSSTNTTKRITLGSLLAVCLFLGTAFAQPSVSGSVGSIRLDTVPAGLQLVVDGITYNTPVTLLWPQFSTHTIHTFNQGAVASGAQYALQNWTGILANGTQQVIAPSSLADPYTIVVTADPNITEIDANFVSGYQVTLSYFNCPAGYSDPGNPCPPTISPGTIVVDNSIRFTMSAVFYVSAGPHTIQAIANPGWIFAGWANGTGNSGGSGFFGTINVTTVNILAPTSNGQSPNVLYPQFVQGRTIAIQSSPPGLQVIADRIVVTTPINLTWGETSTHQLGVTNSQLDNQGKLWVFSGWSDGGTVNHAFVVPAAPQGPAIPVTATFVPGQRVSFYTNPPGLPLTVDGSSAWLSDNFAWAVNSAHTVSAPQTTTDANGNQYTFSSWSQGGPATQTITAIQDPNGLNLQYTANYTASGNSKISVVSTSPGLSIQVDGQPCALPCSFTRPVGTAVHLIAPSSAPLSPDSRLAFQGWNDSSSADRMLTPTNSASLTLTLTYSLQNRLAASSTPAGGATFLMTPTSPDSFFDSQAQVQVSIQTKLGFKFMNWGGDATGISNTVTVNMAAPKSVVAVLNPVPALVDGAVKNVAGVTPIDAVAPGSIISIAGVNLAAAPQAGPPSPLVQALGNLTVSLAEQLLPLRFVSPGRITAQLPPDLPLGAYTLTVHSAGNPDVSAGFTVARNAPGLFHTMVNGNAYGLFIHQDGTPVTVDNPAVQNETVTLSGTGFGPLMQMPTEGFAVSQSPNSAVADPVFIVSSGNTITPSYAGAADGTVGLDSIQFQIAPPFPSGATVDFKINVGGQDSNTVLLPLQ